MNEKIKRVTIIGMLCAVAYIVMLACRIPIVLFLKYEPKDVIITLGGLIWGPAVAVLTSVIVSLVEMVTVSDNGIYGFIMNIVSTCSFAIVVSLIYKKKRTITGAILGLIAGCISMVTIMTLWNIIIVPLYMKTPVEEIMPMIPTVFIPFNLLKAGLNTGFVLLLYKPLTTALKKSGLITEKAKPQKNNSTVIFLISVILIGICVSLFVVLSDSKSNSSKEGTESALSFDSEQESALSLDSEQESALSLDSKQESDLSLDSEQESYLSLESEQESYLSLDSEQESALSLDSEQESDLSLVSEPQPNES